MSDTDCTGVGVDLPGLLASLTGVWSFKRQLERAQQLQGLAKGTAQLLEVAPQLPRTKKLLHYREQGRLTTPWRQHSFVANFFYALQWIDDREWLVVCNDLGSPMFQMCFIEDGLATATHLCAHDIYKAIFNWQALFSANRWSTKYRVTGNELSNKDDYYLTEYRRGEE